MSSINIKGTNCFFIYDNKLNVNRFPISIQSLIKNRPQLSLEAGESLKNIDSIQVIWEWLDDHHVDRHSHIIIAGGGTVTDAVAFASSTYKRGISFTLIPTTVLGMIDAAIGGKTAINLNNYKNQIGTFYPPIATLIDPMWIETLSPLDRMNGWMELTKHALISDGVFWHKINAVNPLVDHAIPPHIERAAAIKEQIVLNDPFEHGERKTLNFGHTTAHALETHAANNGRSLSHGVAVGWGMIWAIAWSQSNSTNADARARMSHAQTTILTWLKALGKTSESEWIHTLNPELLWDPILRDKKNKGAEVRAIRLIDVGKAEWDVPLKHESFTTVWKQVFN